MRSLLPSSGRRFLRIVGFSLLQALLFGSLVGGLVASRVPTPQREEVGAERLALHQRLAESIERLELGLFDWRVRELGRRAERPSEVVPVVLDAETLVQARAQEGSALAVQPWPRWVVGALTEQLVAEGASLVAVDLPLADASPHAPAGPDEPDDETALSRALFQLQGRAVLGFSWSLESVLPPAGPPGPTFLARVGGFASAAEALGPARALLAEGQRVFLIPDGTRFELLVGAATEEEGRALQQAGAEGGSRLRPFLPSDRAFELRPLDLLLSLAAVEVVGLDPAALFQARTLEHPRITVLSEHSGLGSVRLVPDVDGRVRAVPHLIRMRDAEGRSYILPSLPLAAAMAQAGSRRLLYQDGVLEVGGRFRIPMDASGFSTLRWDAAEAGREARGSLSRQVSAWKVWANREDLRRDFLPRYRNELEGKVALLTRAGAAGAPVVDTPIGERVPSGAVLGQALANLLHSDGIRRASPREDLLATMALAFLGAFLALASTGAVRSRAGVLAYFGGAVVLGVSYLAFARHLMLEDGLWLAVAGPLLAMGATFGLTALYALRTEREFAELMTASLGRYVSPEVLRRVRRDVTLLRPERRPMTIFFSDLEGFTSLAERLPPEKVTELLQVYLSAMAGVVRECGGHVDKFMGDALMAFWGAPVRQPRHASRACEAALRMRTVLLERQEEWRVEYGCRLTFRAGLCSGEVLVGDLGSATKSSYSVLGRPVNLASRLERDARRWGSFLVVGEETQKEAGEDFLFRELDRLRVPGQETPWTAYELMASRGAEPSRLVQLLIVWGDALHAYYRRDFAAAQALFQRCLEEFQDEPAAVYVERCRTLQGRTLPEDWDGVFPEDLLQAPPAAALRQHASGTW